MTSVSRRMVTGIAWMSLMRLGIKTLGLVSTVILARLLLPADFGLVAMAMSVVAALELLSAFNFDVALIQRQDADRSYYDTAWTLNITLQLLLALSLFFVSYPAAGFFDEPRLRIVMQVLAIGVFARGFENIGVVAFRKDLEFRKEFALRIAQKLLGTAVTIPLAFVLRNYWALVAGMVSGSIASVAFSYLVHPFRPRASLAARRQLFSFSKWMLVNNSLFFVRDRAPDFLLGKLAGANALGIFTISNEISSLPTAELVAPINRAVLPAYAKMATEPEVLRRGFLDVIGLIALVALPAGLGIAATAELIVNVMLGENWAAAVPLVSVLGIVGTLNALITNCSNAHYAMGRPVITTKCVGFQVALLLPVMVWAAYYYGALGIAYAYLTSVAIVAIPLNYTVILRVLDLPFRHFASRFWRPLIGSVLMYAATSVLVARLPNTLFSLLGAIAFGGAVYTVTVALLWWFSGRPPGPEKTAVDRLAAFIQRRPSGSAGTESTADSSS